MTDFKIRDAQADDIYDVIPWIKKFRKEHFPTHQMDTKYIVGLCEQFINDPERLAIVVEDLDGSVVGFLGAAKSFNMLSPKPVGYVVSVHTEDHKSPRVAMMLLNSAEEWARSNNLESLLVSTPYSNRSLDRLGFKKSEVTFRKEL